MLLDQFLTDAKDVLFFFINYITFCEWLLNEADQTFLHEQIN